jgi:hypothetical protein
MIAKRAGEDQQRKKRERGGDALEPRTLFASFYRKWNCRTHLERMASKKAAGDSPLLMLQL